MSPMKNIFTRNLANLGFGLAILVALILSGFIYNNMRTLVKSNQMVNHTLVVLESLNETLALLIEAESALRGYIITGDERFLKTYKSALSSSNNIHQHLQELRQMTADNANQRMRLDTLDSLVAQKITSIQQFIDSSKVKGIEAVPGASSVESDRHIMEDIHRLIDDMKREEQNLFHQRSETISRISQRTTLAMIIGATLSIFLLISAFFIVNRQINARRRAEETLEQLNKELEQRIEQRTSELVKTSERFRSTLDNLLEGCQIIGFDWRYLYLNEAAARHGKRRKEELLGRTMMECYPGIEETDLFAMLRRCMEERQPCRMENEFTYPDGCKGWFELSIQPAPEGILILSQDITERKRAEEKIQHQIKILSSLYRAAENLVENFSMADRAKNVVRTAVESFGLTLAWLGKAEKDGSISLLAHYPEEISYPLKITVRWDESPEGQGPTGRAVRSGLPQIVQNILDDPSFRPWKDVALKQGQIASAAAFPLIAREHTFGALNLYSHQPGFFTEEKIAEIQTFTHLAAAALENARLYEESLSRLRKITALRNIDMAITGSLDLRVVTKVALEEIINQLKVDAAAILTLDPYTQTLEYIDVKGFYTTEIKKVRIPMDKGISGKVAQERKIIHIPDISHVEEKIFLQRDLLKNEGIVAYYGAPLIAKGKVLGVLEIFHREPRKGDSEWIDYLETLAGQVALAIENAHLIDDVMHKHTELVNAYNQTIEGWGSALALKEEETAEHSQRVTEMTLRIARAMGMNDEDLYHARLGALLHDIGKIGVPDSILLKRDKLTDEEWEIMKKHPEYAFQMLSPIAYLRKAMEIPYCHHEKWDGTGYPRGLKGKQIPLSARIFAVVDVWDALSSDRPYRKAWPRDKVIEYIRSQSGTHFDPEVVEVFMKILNEDMES